MTRLFKTPIIGRSAMTVVSSWIDMLAGLSIMYCLRTPPCFWASAAPLAAVTAKRAKNAVTRRDFGAISFSQTRAFRRFARPRSSALFARLPRVTPSCRAFEAHHRSARSPAPCACCMLRCYRRTSSIRCRPMISDPIEFELFKNALFGVADEMALTVFRTTYSGVLKDNMDYSTALFDGEGVLVAQGLTLPGHLGSMPTAIAALQAAYADRIHPGDVFILNDPFAGGMHLPDVFVFKPIFRDNAVIAWAGTVCHHTDVGGRVPGSNASDSTEIYQEGLRIPPLKLYERGSRNDTLWALIERNVRVPVKVFGDLRAQLAACHISERALIELAGRYGVAKLQDYMTELVDYSERMTRAAIRELPDGVYGFLDHIDDDGIDVGKPIPLKVTITKTGDRIHVDWTGTAPQVKGAINNTLSYTKSASYCGIRSILPQNVPTNEGVFRAITVEAPPGTIANGVLPAACAARGLTGFRMVDCMFGALSQMLPDKVFASSDGGNT